MTPLPADTLARDAQTSAIIDAAIEVHKVLGRGFAESVYRRPLEIEFLRRRIPYRKEVEFAIVYKGELTGVTYRVDFVCFGAVLVELKALGRIGGAEEAQILNYLRASGLKRGLILNFGTPLLEIRRRVWGDPQEPSEDQSTEDTEDTEST